MALECGTAEGAERQQLSRFCVRRPPIRSPSCISNQRVRVSLVDTRIETHRAAAATRNIAGGAHEGRPDTMTFIARAEYRGAPRHNDIHCATTKQTRYQPSPCANHAPLLSSLRNPQ